MDLYIVMLYNKHRKKSFHKKVRTVSIKNVKTNITDRRIELQKSETVLINTV